MNTFKGYITYCLRDYMLVMRLYMYSADKPYYI